MIEHYFWMAVCIGAVIFEIVFILNIPRIYRAMVDCCCIGNKFNELLKIRREQ